jgi:hypothetical protein
MGVHQQGAAQVRDPDSCLQTSLGVGDTGREGAVEGKFAKILGDLAVEIAEPVWSGEQELGLIFEFKTTCVG